MPVPSSRLRPRLQLSVRPVTEIADYIRHVRRETLKAIRVDPAPALIEPLSRGVYLVARMEGEDEPVGLIESAFLHHVYADADALPYRDILDFSGLCAFEQLAGVRTVYVKPGFRSSRALYLKLIVAQSRIFASFGASFALATTNAANDWLRGLYERTGGRRLGTFMHESSREPVALFLFSIDDLARHPLAERHVSDADLVANRAAAAAVVG